jgi:hypothetical protein
MMSTRSSAEFPLRSPVRKWAVMNDVPGDGEEGGQERVADPVGSDAKEEVASKSETQATGYEDIRRQIAELATRLSGFTEILEGEGSRIRVTSSTDQRSTTTRDQERLIDLVRYD